MQPEHLSFFAQVQQMWHQLATKHGNLLLTSVIPLAVGLPIVRKLLAVFWEHCTNSLTYSLQIPSKDESYACLQEMLFDEAHRHNSISCNRHMVDTVYQPNNPHDPEVILSPNYGSHFIVFDGRYILYTRDQDKAVDISLGGKAESIILTTVPWRKTDLQDMVRAALEYSKLKERGKLVIYTSCGGSWRKLGRPSKPRSLDSIILPRSLKDSIIKDIADFRRNKEWYRSLGIPYRRGYLLYGPPGCGKSSFIKALAGYFGLPLCLLHLSSKELNDDSFTELLNDAHPESILVIEDIDVAFSEGDDGSRALTLSGLLNALDGIASQEGRILFMTTNHKEALNKALIRPGRVDQYYQFGLAVRYQIQDLFLNFFRGVCAEEDGATFAALVPENAYSIAELQKYLIMYKDRPKDAIMNVALLQGDFSQHTDVTENATPSKSSLPVPEIEQII